MGRGGIGRAEGTLVYCTTAITVLILQRTGKGFFVPNIHLWLFLFFCLLSLFYTNSVMKGENDTEQVAYDICYHLYFLYFMGFFPVGSLFAGFAVSGRVTSIYCKRDNVSS